MANRMREKRSEMSRDVLAPGGRGSFVVPQTPGGRIRALGFARMGARGLNGPADFPSTGKIRARDRVGLGLALAALLVGGAAPAAAQQVALLQGLDKITARISTFEAPLGEAVRFGTFEIVARACKKRPPEEPPESAAFLEIVDLRPDSDAVQLFTGWMFASSPALSAVEHPVYDVWVIDCRKASSSAASSSEGN
jgi:hypothetical protein